MRGAHGWGGSVQHMCSWIERKQAVNVKITLDFEDSMKNAKHLNNYAYRLHAAMVMFWIYQVNEKLKSVVLKSTYVRTF